MVRLLPLILTALLAAVPARAEQPIAFRHVVGTGNGDVPIPMELYLTAVNDDLIAVKLAGNLRSLQSVLPGLLSRVVEDTCRRRIGVEVQEVRPESDALRLTGRIQIQTYRCRDPDDLGTRMRLFSNITAFDARVTGSLDANCLAAELTDLSIDPQGLVGGILNLTGLSPRIAARARDAVNDALQDRVKCIDLPSRLKLVDTRIESGGFRDFGDGEMGFVVSGTIDVRARNLVALITALAQAGEMDN
jgi:hypothetical protein